MSAWPSDLPAPSLDGFSVNPIDATVRTEMSAGLPRVRRVSIAQFKQVSFGVLLTQAQAQVFDAWFYSSTGANAGAAWFSLLLKLPEGTAAKMCRFVGPYKADRAGQNWKITAQVEVQDA